MDDTQIGWEALNYRLHVYICISKENIIVEVIIVGQYKKNSLSLTGAVGLGTGVMISAGIFALLGQVAELSGIWFPVMFIIGGIVTGFSAYSYVKMSNEYPSAGGIAMFLVKAYGKGTLTASAAMLMAVSMVINQSLVARTFGTYTLQIFNID